MEKSELTYSLSHETRMKYQGFINKMAEYMEEDALSFSRCSPEIGENKHGKELTLDCNTEYWLEVLKQCAEGHIAKYSWEGGYNLTFHEIRNKAVQTMQEWLDGQTRPYQLVNDYDYSETLQRGYICGKVWADPEGTE
jgi:hypothetical protein